MIRSVPACGSALVDSNNALALSGSSYGIGALSNVVVGYQLDFCYWCTIQPSG